MDQCDDFSGGCALDRQCGGGPSVMARRRIVYRGRPVRDRHDGGGVSHLAISVSKYYGQPSRHHDCDLWHCDPRGGCDRCGVCPSYEFCDPLHRGHPPMVVIPRHWCMPPRPADHFVQRQGIQAPAARTISCSQCIDIARVPRRRLLDDSLCEIPLRLDGPSAIDCGLPYGCLGCLADESVFWTHDYESLDSRDSAPGSRPHRSDERFFAWTAGDCTTRLRDAADCRGLGERRASRSGRSTTSQRTPFSRIDGAFSDRNVDIRSEWDLGLYQHRIATYAWLYCGGVPGAPAGRSLQGRRLEGKPRSLETAPVRRD